MRIRRTAFACIVVGLSAALLMSCGGGYGGGGSLPAATLTISVAPTTITLGQSATVTWTSNASCMASGAWSGAKAASGSETVTPTVAGPSIYTLICSGGAYGSSASKSATLTVNPAMVAGLWSGNGCCIKSDPFPVTGITSDSGDDRFLLLGTHYVGKMGATQTAYATCQSCLAGTPVTDSNDFKLLSILARVSAGASNVAPNLATEPTTVSFTVPYDQSFERPSATATVQGVYTTNLGTGYTLAIAIDATGQVTGNDTNGCNLAGNVSTSHPAVDYYDVVLDVSTCGNSNGRYNGNAALIFDSTGRATALFLSASNANAAIGWLLSR